MKISSLLALSLISAGALVIGAVQLASGCECVPITVPVEESVKSAEAVFLGTVTKIETTGDMRIEHTIATFQVLTAWKGIPDKEVKIETNSSSAACGIDFQPGQTYLVFASRVEEKLTAFLCSRTRLKENAADDLKELGEELPLKPTASSN